MIYFVRFLNLFFNEREMLSSLPDRPRRIWNSTEFRNVFYNQYVCFLGDSIQRAIYKDFVKLHQCDDHLTPQNLKAKGEDSFMGDRLLRRSPRMTNGKDYEEIRCYQHDTNIFKFFFLTKIYSDYVESVVFKDLKEMPPDILVVNSCVWDITRYGPEAISEYKTSLERFFTRLCHDRVIPETTEIIWMTTLPLGAEIKGGFIVSTVQFMDVSRLRLDILEANRWVAENVAQFYDVNVLDLHFMLRNYQQWRELDGIHWSGYAHRYMTSAICEFIEYLNIRALRERREQTNKDKFSEGANFAQPLVPLAQSNNKFQMPTQDTTVGPLRTRRLHEPTHHYREATLTRRPSSDRAANFTAQNYANAGYEFNQRSVFGLSNNPLPRSSTDVNPLSGQQIRRPFWSNF